MRYKNKKTGSIVNVPDDMVMDVTTWEALGELAEAEAEPEVEAVEVETKAAEEAEAETEAEPEVVENKLHAEAEALGISFKADVSDTELKKMISKVKKAAQK